MKSESMLELRVLSGTHAGARVLIPGEPQVLGSDPSCDLILTDEGVAGQHARLTVEEDGSVQIEWLGEAPPRVLRLSLGQSTELTAGLRIGIATADSPWEDTLEVLIPDVAILPSDRPIEAGPHPSPDGRGWLGSLNLTPLALVAIAVLGFAGLIMAIITVTTGARSPQATVSPASSPSVLASPDTVTQALAALELGARIRVEPDARRGARVRAAFLSQTESERLVAVVSGLSPRPRLEILTHEDLVLALDEALLSYNDPQRGRPIARVTGPGQVRIEGRVRDTALREQLQGELQRAFPLVQAFDWNLLTDEELAQKFLTELQALQVGNVTGSWADGRLRVEARLHADRVPLWERGLAALAPRHPVPFEATLVTLPPLRPSLPFTVRSIVGGAMPFVTLSGGRKLVLEGESEGWRLVRIDAASVLFEHRDGTRVTVER